MKQSAHFHCKQQFLYVSILLLAVLPIHVLASPTVTSVTPGYSAGAHQTLSFQYSESTGYTHIQVADMMINSSLNQVGACYTLYYVATNTLYLASNDATAWMGPISPGTSGTLQNAQCSVDASKFSVAGSGPTLTLNLDITLMPSFSGLKTIYGWVLDNSGQNSGAWTALGSWLPETVPTPPSVVSVTPNYGVGASQTFSLQYSDANGPSYLAAADMLINSSLNPADSCYTLYYPSSNQLYLAKDDVSGWLGPLSPGASATLQNSQCSINGGQSSVSNSGTTLILNLAITFQPSFANLKTIYGWTIDKAGSSSGAWAPLGTWVPSSAELPPPAVVSVTPNQSSSGPHQILSFKYSDTAGYTHIQVADMIINSSLNQVGACYTLYYAATNTLYLATNDATGWLGPVSPGTSGTVQNSQCTVDASHSSVTGAGPTLTVNLDITLTQSVAGLETIYGWVLDNSGQSSGAWSALGTWTPNPVSTPPSVIPMTPSSVYGNSQVLSLQYWDANGYTYLQAVDMIVNVSLNPADACYTLYYPASQTLYLAKDDVSGWLGPITPGGTGTLQNSQCSISASKSSVSGLGTTLTLNLAVTLQPSFVGFQRVYGWALDNANISSGPWATVGTWYSGID